MSQFFASSGQSIGVSASASVLPMNTQDLFPLGWAGLISLQSKGLKSLLQHHSSKALTLWCSALFIVQLSHPYTTAEKTIALARRTFVGKVMFLLFNKLVITFPPRSKRLSWLQSPSAVILEPKKIVCHCWHCFPIHLPRSDGASSNLIELIELRLLQNRPQQSRDSLPVGGERPVAGGVQFGHGTGPWRSQEFVR